jgi:glycerol-3-phosphate dehydrogenase
LPQANKIKDVFIIGSGINGCGIASDAAGRWHSVALAKVGDLGAVRTSFPIPKP